MCVQACVYLHFRNVIIVIGNRVTCIVQRVIEIFAVSRVRFQRFYGVCFDEAIKKCHCNVIQKRIHTHSLFSPNKYQNKNREHNIREKYFDKKK